jgi:CHAT domain-containing protein
VHFSTHGVFNKERPLVGSGLQLAKGGLPEAQSTDALLTPELMGQLPLADAHVTLRACVSGLATQITSREPLGAIHGLFSAGAASVLAAAWNVDMGAAGEWMLAFYRAWSTPGVTAARAQRLAIKAMKRAGRGHPFEWAPFVLYGAPV